jgi:transposase
VELFETIRRDHRLKDLSVRELARLHKVHRRTVRQALASAEPPGFDLSTRKAPVLGPWHDIIREWLIADKDEHKKQRHTARRVWQRLVDEHGAQVAESTVRAFVAQVRAEIAGKVGDVAIVQDHQDGAEAEVDFGEFWIYIGGISTKVYLFAMRLSASGKALHHAYATCAQEAFFDGHVRSFERFDGVPGRIRYDNLKPAVVRVLIGRERTESERFIVLRSHYGFDSFYCIPGVEGAHEKGGIEGDIGRFRRNHLVPVPHVETLSELNELLANADDSDDCRHIDGRINTVAVNFAHEALQLRPLAAEPFDTAVHLRSRVDSKSRIMVRQCRYSVPVRLAGRFVQVRLGATMLEVRHDGSVVATHERATKKGTETLVLDHYLETLQRKPGAFVGSTTLAQARQAGTFTETHERLWQQARRALGDGPGTKVLIDVLLLHRSLIPDAIKIGIEKALSVGSFDAEVIAVEARRHLEPGLAPVIPIDTALHIERALPDISDYDELLENN